MYKQELSKCEGSLVNTFAFTGGFAFAMYYTWGSSEVGQVPILRAKM
ncbi:MAG: hypothetical protein P4M11_12065 [Candidatus Pacebacteria bacterium]|nr:hypothetical protein [Candidatus Paceibacterota bacterium]